MGEIRKKVWFGLLDADMNYRYFEHLASRYYHLDLYSKVFLAFMASGAVGGWIIWQDPAAYPYGVLTWKILSSASAVLSVVMPIINVAKKLEAASRLKGEWNDVVREYDVLWLRVEGISQQKAIEEVARIGHMESELAAVEAILPTNDRKLTRRCQNEVKQARGLQ